MKIDKNLIPVKAHYFSFLAAIGCTLPYAPVYGKQLGVSAFVMGSITAVIPPIYLVLKPTVGFLMDYFKTRRKTIFVSLLTMTLLGYLSLYVLPTPTKPFLPDESFRDVHLSEIRPCQPENIDLTDICQSKGTSTNCQWNCEKSQDFNNSIYFWGSTVTMLNNSCILSDTTPIMGNLQPNCKVSCERTEEENACLYKSPIFWCFIILISVSELTYEVVNTLSDAMCFEVLGKGREKNYGVQRLWGSLGFGLAALVSGSAVDWWSGDNEVKSFTPAIIMTLAFSILDLLMCCYKLKISHVSSDKVKIADVFNLMRDVKVVIFLVFAIIPRFIDSFLWHYLFWHLDDIAINTGYTHQIKLITGLYIFVQTFAGELLFFLLSGKILNAIGYGWTMSLSFVMFFVKLYLHSIVPNPWWTVPIAILQGPTYALSYAAIASYAKSVAPAGATATLQGIICGTADGLGVTLGSFVGGILYNEYGSRDSFKVMSMVAVAAAIGNLIVHFTCSKRQDQVAKTFDKESYTSVEDKG